MAFSFQIIQTGNTMIDRIQSNIKNAFNQIIGPFIGGQLITNQLVATSNTVINHGLGRIPQIWVLCDQLNPHNVYRVSWDANSITLVSSGGSSRISVWVN